MYTKFQIALQYFPEHLDHPKRATRKLCDWIKGDKPLQHALANAGYRPCQRHFTQRQYEILKEYIGDP